VELILQRSDFDSLLLNLLGLNLNSALMLVDGRFILDAPLFHERVQTLDFGVFLGTKLVVISSHLSNKSGVSSISLVHLLQVALLLGWEVVAQTLNIWQEFLLVFVVFI
jgi:hypothetical protein